MGKNRTFQNSYKIVVSGKCTNGFMAKIMDRTLKAFVKALIYSYPNQDISLEVLETKGDYSALTEDTIE